MKKLTSVLLVAGGLLAAVTVNATPFASCISNIANTVYFNLNEKGGNVTVTYEDGSTNANFNGITTGLNLPTGYQHFDLTGHTSYNISVYKAGNGIPTVVTNIARGSARGIAANVRGSSPYFGYLYSEIGGAGLVLMRSDGVNPGPAVKPAANNFTWTGSYQEYFISVAPDDSVLISDFTSPSQGGVIWANPQLTSANLILANDSGLLSGDMIDYNHGDEESRAILTAGIGNNPTLWVIDGSYGDGSSVPYNTIMRYDLGTAVFSNGTLPWNGQPNVIGASVNPSNIQGSGSTGFFRDGLAIGTNGYIYLSVDRANLSNPNLQVYAPDANTLLWSSFYKDSQGQTQDYVRTGTQQLPENGQPVAEMALSPDNRYIACVHDDNHLTILSMTNGIPDISTEYQISWTNNVSTATAGRYVCWDAANNLWVASYTAGVVAQITTGRTGTAITSGNASGPTGFQVLTPTEVDITSVQALAPQANSYAGYPVASTNTITRSGNISSPLTIPFVITGTAPNGTYVVSITNTVSFAAGQSSTNVTVTAVTDGIPRPTTTVIMQLQDNGSGQYIVGFQNQATTFIVNTATPQLSAAVGASSMYKAYSNDYTSITLTRIGDTNVAVTTSAFTYGGAAVKGTDYASVSTTASFAKGDLTKTVHVAKPLVNGLPPVHSSSATYTGDKTFTVTVPSGTGYTVATNNTATFTIVDSAYPSATVLYSNPLTDPNDVANWNLTAVAGDATAAPDYTVEFGYDLTSNNGETLANGLIPLPPNGATSALRVTTGKQFMNEADAVNLYLTNQVFSGNYAVRFNMYIVQGQNLTATDEGPMFGINHDGLETNWWFGSGTLTPGLTWSADGVWYWVDALAGGFTSDYMEFTGISNNIPNSGWRRPATTTYASFQNQFKDPEDFTTVNTTSNAVAGLPANASPFVKPSAIGNWADVQVMNSNNIVTMWINHKQIFSFNNTNTLFQQGNVMLGYETPSASQTGAGVEAAVYYSGLQVVSISSGTTQPPTISSTSVSGGNVIINFTSPNGTDTSSSFTVQSMPVVTGTFADTPATITGGSGTFQAVVPVSGATQFFRIHHN